MEVGVSMDRGSARTGTSNRRRFLEGAVAALAGSSVLAGRETQPDSGTDWSRIRKQFLLKPGTIYLNCASIGVPPAPVVDVLARNRRSMAVDPVGAKGRLSRRIIDQVRPSLAGFLGVDPREVAFTQNASQGLQSIAAGIPLKRGDEVLTTSHEHPAGIRPWRRRAQFDGIVVHEILMPSPLPPKEEILERISARMTPRTRALFFCQVTRGGLLNPTKELCALARERGVLSAVDGAQAVGMMPVDLRDLGCDFYAASLHKWVLAPAGTGVLYVRQEVQDEFSPGLALDEPTDARRFQMPGTFGYSVRASLGDAIAFLRKIGLERIGARNRRLSDTLKERLASLPRVRLISSRSPGLSSPGITIFEVPGHGGMELRAGLEERGIGVDDHVRDGHDAVRIATHFFNTRAEIDRTLSVLQELIRA